MTYLTLKAPPAVKSTVLVQDSPNIVGKTKSNVSAYKITAIDWRFKLNSTNANLVPKVRSQGSCGSCWAFAATTSMEFSVSIQFKIYGNFSNA